MLTRRAVLSAPVLLVLTDNPVFAASSIAFTNSAFESAQKEGKQILIEIVASWCPTCRAQEPIIKDLLGSAKFKDMVALRVDFDEQKDVVRALGAQSQSTLIVFVGMNEVGRSVGETNPASIEELLGRAL